VSSPSPTLESLCKSHTNRVRLFGIAQSRMRKSDLRLRGSWVDRQVLVSEKIALLPQLLCAGREKCTKSEWSRHDGWTNYFPSSRIDQIVIGTNTIQCQRPGSVMNSRNHAANQGKSRLFFAMPKSRMRLLRKLSIPLDVNDATTGDSAVGQFTSWPLKPMLLVPCSSPMAPFNLR
jgi:hypothetical protein